MVHKQPTLPHTMPLPALGGKVVRPSQGAAHSAARLLPNPPTRKKTNKINTQDLHGLSDTELDQIIKMASSIKKDRISASESESDNKKENKTKKNKKTSQKTDNKKNRKNYGTCQEK